MRTYSRIKIMERMNDGGNCSSVWLKDLYDVMNWIESHQLGWNPWQAKKSDQEMYERIFL
ncbi:MAG: hypothetical protein CM15mL4_3060 [uncultured marine virus]|nr:MAG: hypothetical protein CM15mL4_3060 [uncultured marine virus]